MRRAVLDASAVLAHLLNEPGQDEVRDAIFAHSVMSVVNFAEVATRYALRGASVERVRELGVRLGITLLPVDEDIAVEAALIAGPTRRAGLSLGDRICLMTAKREGLPALTADRRWADVSTALGVEVVLIR